MVAIVRRQPTQADVAKMEQIRRENGDIILTKIYSPYGEKEIICENGARFHKCNSESEKDYKRLEKDLSEQEIIDIKKSLINSQAKSEELLKKLIEHQKNMDVER